MDDAELRIAVTYDSDNVATEEFEVNSVNKDIVNKCGRIIVNSSRLVNYWRKGVTLHGQQKIMRKITGFRFEKISVEIAHTLYRFVRA